MEGEGRISWPELGLFLAAGSTSFASPFLSDGDWSWDPSNTISSWVKLSPTGKKILIRSMRGDNFILISWFTYLYIHIQHDKDQELTRGFTHPRHHLLQQGCQPVAAWSPTTMLLSHGRTPPPPRSLDPVHGTAAEVKQQLAAPRGATY